MPMPPPSEARTPERQTGRAAGPPGWRVDPPTSGGGGQEQPWWRRLGWLPIVVVVLLGLNYWAASRVTQHERVRIPYSPFFLEQVRHGNVESITSKGTTIEGLFKKATRYGQSARNRR